jgi:hypothetical protein
MQCNPVKRPDGKCIISIKMASALVVDAEGNKHVVLRRRLRLNKESDMNNETVDLTALNGLFVDERAAKIMELESKGWSVRQLGGDWIVKTPEGKWLGPAERNQIWLFKSQEIAWDQLIKAGA